VTAVAVTGSTITSLGAPVESPRAFPVDTAELHAKVTVTYEWQLRTQIQTMHRHWVFDDGRQARIASAGG
jgi:hypothetical protein